MSTTRKFRRSRKVLPPEIFSWEGLEDRRDKLRELATRWKDLDKQAEERHDSDVIIGESIGAFVEIRDGCKRSNARQGFSEIGQIIYDIGKIYKELIEVYHVNWYFIHKECVIILNPCEASIRRANENIEKDMKNQVKRTRK